ncbi:MAG: exodeoxyribonuclease III [Gammaproteobacteria bacterium]|nr:exodeoxyribonuclease III [Gammaproteobacteria bacterium]
MKIFSFNVNSVRARLHQLEALVDKYQPEVIGLQETKVTDEDFPVEDIAGLGYDVAFLGQKTHYGVAIMYRGKVSEIRKGFVTDDESSQKRFISATLEMTDTSPLTVLNGYFPQGENRKHPTKFPAKIKFYEDLNAHLQINHSNEEHLCVIGDMNIAPADADIGIGENNKKRWLRDGKTSFLPEEREMLTTLKGWGLEDQFRRFNPDVSDRFSWFDYRSKGFEDDPKRGLRIDLLLASPSLAARAAGSDIDYEIRAMDRPSDHCPVWAEFDLEVRQ